MFDRVVRRASTRWKSLLVVVVVVVLLGGVIVLSRPNGGLHASLGDREAVVTSVPTTSTPAPTTSPAPQGTVLPVVVPDPASFAGVVPSGCIQTGLGSDPGNAIPLRIDIADIPSPVEETGFSIGDQEHSSNPSPASITPTYWAVVGNADADFVFGYIFVPFMENTVAPELLDPDCDPGSAIYDEQGVLIGAFVGATPVVVGE